MNVGDAGAGVHKAIRPILKRVSATISTSNHRTQGETSNQALFGTVETDSSNSYAESLVRNGRSVHMSCAEKPRSETWEAV